jgi:hypothetical protein
MSLQASDRIYNDRHLWEVKIMKLKLKLKLKLREWKRRVETGSYCNLSTQTQGKRNVTGTNIPDAAKFLSVESVRHVTSSVCPSKNLTANFITAKYEGNRVGKKFEKRSRGCSENSVIEKATLSASDVSSEARKGDSK